MAACLKCATPLPADAVFCPRCGASTPTDISGERAATTIRAPTPSGAEATSSRRAELQRALGTGFEVKDLIGQGGFGEVWAATDVKLKRDVAVKVLRQDLVASPSLLERFRREAEAAAKLRHPNIVPIYQVGEAEGLVYFVMPLIKGESLRGVLEREGRVEVAEAVRILTDAASALHEAHEAGIVHRDVKPDNILLEGPQRRVLLMDFGIAKSLEPQDGGLTGTGMVIGTPQYMSPEQASGEKQIDARSDLYSLGVVAYQMLAGRLPFEAESAQGMIVAHITAAPDPIEKVRTGVPEDLAAAVMRALAKKPADRFASAAEFADAARPPVPVSEESPLRWVTKRLKQSVRGARRRLAWYGAALVALVAYLFAFQSDLLRQAESFWTPGAQLRDLSYGGHVPELYPGPKLFVVGDSLVGVAIPGRAGLAFGLFDGSTWRRVQAPEGGFFDPVVFSSGDSVFVVDGHPYSDSSMIWFLGSESFRPAGAAGMGAMDVWTDGSAVALWYPGLLGWRGRQGWRIGSVTSGQSVPFGRRVETLRAWKGPNILQFRDPFWQSQDPRPDSNREWRYEAGTQLPNGISIVVGFECTGERNVGNWYAESKCSPLALREDSVGGGWRRVDDALPRTFRPYGVAAVADDEFLVWGGYGASRWSDLAWGGYRLRPDSAAVAPVYEYARGRFTPVAALGGRRVSEIVVASDNPYALLVDGSLWARLRGVWGRLTEVPGLVVRSQDAFETGRPGHGRRRLGGSAGDYVFEGYAESDSGGWRAAYPVADDRPLKKVVAVSGGLFLLAEDGRLFVYDCPVARVYAVCPPREVTPRGQPPLTDIARVAADTILAVGRSGFIATLTLGTGQWVVSRSPGLVGHDFVGVVTSNAGADVALAAESIWRREGRGDWELWAELPAWLRPGRRVASSRGNRAAVVGADGKVGLLSDSLARSWALVNTCGGVEALAFLDLQRLVVVGGTLRVVGLDLGPSSPNAPRGRCERVWVPEGTWLVGVDVEGNRVQAWGNGLFQGRWSASQLPFADASGRAR